MPVTAGGSVARIRLLCWHDAMTVYNSVAIHYTEFTIAQVIFLLDLFNTLLTRIINTQRIYLVR